MGRNLKAMRPGLGLLVVLSLLVALGRLTVPTRPLSGWPLTYEALAHLWVGVLLAVAVCRWREAEGKPAACLLGLLTAFEVGMFLLGRLK